MLSILIVRSGFSQDFDSGKVLDVIKKWNFANNARSEESLREIYDNRVTIYGQELSQDKAIDLKSSFFSANPNFRQKIITDPTFKRYGSGLVKTEFVREVFQSGRWQKNPTYLLVNYQNNSYKIAGESALSVDRKQNDKFSVAANSNASGQSRKPQPVQPLIKSNQNKIAEPEEFKDAGFDSSASSSNSIDSGVVDSTESFIASSDPEDSVSSEAKDAEDSTIISSVTEEILSEETVPVPKKYVYLAIGVLTLAALVVLLIRRPRRSSLKQRAATNGRETELIRNERTFEGFVVSLFNPHYFKRLTVSRRHAYAGDVKVHDYVPSLEFEFQGKDCHVRLAIECIYIPKLASREILAHSSNQINRYHHYEEGSGTEVYLILGLEGTPADPKEIYLIPADELREGVMGYQSLQPFRKYGMFFYNATRRRLL